MQSDLFSSMPCRLRPVEVKSVHACTKHLRPEYARRLRAEKQAGGSGWETIKWKQQLYEDMCIEIARANYAMLKERTLPPRVA